MMKMNTEKLGTIALLVVFVLMVASAESTLASGSASNKEVLVKNSREHYVMALETYNSGNYGKVRGQLQAAASNAKHADPELAGLLEYLSVNFDTSSSVQTETLLVKAREIATIYNTYNGQYGWNLPNFDPGNPTAIPPGEGAT